MRKILLIISIALAAINNNQAQNFAPIGAKWYYTQPSINSSEVTYTWFESIKDTIIMGQSCRKIIGEVGCSWKADFVFDRNDSVFYYNSVLGEFCLLYNFNANQGDEWVVLHAWDLGNGMVDSSTIIVDSVKVMSVDNVDLKVLYTRHKTSGEDVWFFGGRHIERIGGEYLFPVYQSCDPIPGELRCYMDNDIFLKQGAFECDEIVSSIENKHISEIKIYPNPTNGKIWVSGLINNEKQIKIEVFNLFGNQLQSKYIDVMENLNFDISSYSDGIYFIKFTNANNMYNHKIILKK
jgi:hypothetical protein